MKINVFEEFKNYLTDTPTWL